VVVVGLEGQLMVVGGKGVEVVVRGRRVGGVALFEGGFARLEAVLERHAVVVVVQVLEGLEDFLIVTLAKNKKLSCYN